MTMEYVNQSAGSIRLCLTTGSFDYTQFTILEQKTVTFGALSLEIGILGESHYVQYSAEDEHLHEICACSDVHVPEDSKPIRYDFLPNINETTISSTIGQWNYAFDYFYLTWEEGMKLLEYYMITKNTDVDITSVEFTFPIHTNETDEPMTAVFATKNNNTLEIRSFHTYPNEGIVVSTQSKLIGGNQ